MGLKVACSLNFQSFCEWLADFENRFPVERVLGEYVEDGKCELWLEVWKHPERPSHIGKPGLAFTGSLTGRVKHTALVACRI